MDMTERKRVTKDEFIRALEAELERPEGSLTADQVLANVEGWDSMAALLFISLVNTKFGVIVSGDQIASARTVNDLLLLVHDKLDT